MAMHQRGAPLCKKPTWKQFRSKSGADRKGVRPEQFQLAMKYYGMPMLKEKAQKIFNVIDFKNDGIIDYDEFVGVVLGELKEWKPTEGTLEAPVRYRDDIDATQTIILENEHVVSKPEADDTKSFPNSDTMKDLNIDPALLEMDEEESSVNVPKLNLTNNDNNFQVLSNTSLIPDLNNLKNSTAAKLGPVAVAHWKELQHEFRKLDTRRKGYVSKLQFAGVFSAYDVVLDEFELEYILNTYGTKLEKNSRNMNLNRSHVYEKHSSFECTHLQQQRPVSAMSLNSTTASIQKNGGIMYSKVLRAILLGANNTAELNNSIMRSMSSSGLRKRVKSRAGTYRSKYVISAYDPDIHDLVY